jgi:hypothetical protein
MDTKLMRLRTIIISALAVLPLIALGSDRAILYEGLGRRLRDLPDEEVPYHSRLSPYD